MHNTVKLFSRLVFFVISLFFMNSCQSEGDKEQVISGVVQSVPPGQYLYLEQLTDKGFTMLDSVQTDEKGAFSFSRKIKGIDFYRVMANPKNYVIFILDSVSKIQLSADYSSMNKSAVVTGTKDNELLHSLNKQLKGYYRQNDSLMQLWKNRNPQQDENLLQNQLKASFEQVMQKQTDGLLQFIRQNKSSFSILSAVENLNPDQYAAVYKEVDSIALKNFPQSFYVQSFHQRIETILRLSPGAEAPEISMRSPEGKTISLSSTRGKIVLLDFWASWCQPCRAQSANLVRMYNKYKKNGFEIYSVSLDNNEEAWKKAIKSDQLDWIHVSDLANWESKAVKLYNLESIPQTYLLDKSGKILMKGLIGYELESKLDELFSQN